MTLSGPGRKFANDVVEYEGVLEDNKRALEGREMYPYRSVSEVMRHFCCCTNFSNPTLRLIGTLSNLIESYPYYELYLYLQFGQGQAQDIIATQFWKEKQIAVQCCAVHFVG